jgi:hypothetical protein
MPSIVYAFAKGCVLAGLDGHGFAQTIGLIVIEAIDASVPDLVQTI